MLLGENIQTQSECCTICLRGRGTSPFLDTVQVEDVEAALAAPHRGHEPDDFTAHHALVLLLRQLFNQTPYGWTSAEVQTRVAQPTLLPHGQGSCMRCYRIVSCSFKQSNLSVSPCSLASWPRSSGLAFGFDDVFFFPLWPERVRFFLSLVQL